MDHKRRNFTNYSLFAVFVLFSFTLFLLLSYHKSQLVVLQEGSLYKNVIQVGSYKNFDVEQGFNFQNFTSNTSNFIINNITKITATFVKVLSNITENEMLSSYILVIILVFLPFLICFFISLYLSTKIEPERLFSFAILSSAVSCFTFFSSIMMEQGDTEDFDKVQIPLEQISAYAIFNILFFTIMFFATLSIIDSFRNSEEN